MVENGVVDTLKVIRSILEDAVSVGRYFKYFFL